jgi:hypothetical protein
MADPTLDVDHFIELDRQAFRLQLGAGSVLLLIGMLGVWGTLGTLVGVQGPNIDMITKGVGLVISLAGLFPFNSCWSRWERMKTLRAIKLNPALLDADSTHELVRKLYAKFLGV